MEMSSIPSPKRTQKTWKTCKVLSNATFATRQDTSKGKAQNKPLTWSKREIKSKYHNNKIFALNYLDYLDEIKGYTQKIKEDAKLMELPKNQDFQ